MSQKYSGLRDSSTEMETRIRSLEEERDGLKEELGKSQAATGTAQKQLKMIKGVAVQQSTETYEKSMQLETQLLELQVCIIMSMYMYVKSPFLQILIVYM